MSCTTCKSGKIPFHPSMCVARRVVSAAMCATERGGASAGGERMRGGGGEKCRRREARGVQADQSESSQNFWRVLCLQFLEFKIRQEGCERGDVCSGARWSEVQAGRECGGGERREVCKWGGSCEARVSCVQARVSCEAKPKPQAYMQTPNPKSQTPNPKIPN